MSETTSGNRHPVTTPELSHQMRKFLLKTFENIRKRLKIFENIRKMMRNVRKYSKIFDFFAGACANDRAANSSLVVRDS